MCGRITQLCADELRHIATWIARYAGERCDRDRLLGASDACDEHLQCELHRALNVSVVREGAVPGCELPCLLPSGELIYALWGCSTSWTARPIINTRIESVDSPFWKEAFECGRCLVPVAQFFEPHHSERARNPRTQRISFRPYVFESDEQAPLLLAALLRDGCVSIVTTNPNHDVVAVHDRMPLIIDPSEVNIWFSQSYRSLASQDHIRLVSRPEFQEPEQLSLFE